MRIHICILKILRDQLLQTPVTTVLEEASTHKSVMTHTGTIFAAG